MSVIHLSLFLADCVLLQPLTRFLFWSSPLSPLVWSRFHLAKPIPILQAEFSCAAYSMPWWWRKYVRLKFRSTSSRLHGATSQKAVIFRSFVSCISRNYSILSTIGICSVVRDVANSIAGMYLKRNKRECTSRTAALISVIKVRKLEE
jgi:hypothetical protein